MTKASKNIEPRGARGLCACAKGAQVRAVAPTRKRASKDARRRYGIAAYWARELHAAGVGGHDQIITILTRTSSLCDEQTRPIGNRHPGAASYVDKWPDKSWNGGRIIIGIGGRNNRNPQCVF